MRGANAVLASVFGTAVLFTAWACGSGSKSLRGDRFQDLLLTP